MLGIAKSPEDGAHHHHSLVPPIFADENEDANSNAEKRDGDGEDGEDGNGQPDDLLNMQEDDLLDDEPERKGCSERLSRFMVPPQNRRLKNFHLLVSLTLYVDFFVTSFVLGNHRF